MWTPQPLYALVADDDPMARLLVEGALAAQSYQVELAADGATAIDMARARRYDLVVLDVEMPVLDGFGACAAIRALDGYADTPILMATGFNDLASTGRAFESGASEFVAKPLNMVLFEHRIRFLEKASRATREMRLLSEVIDATREGMLILDAQLRAIRINPAFTRITGFDLAQMQARGAQIADPSFVERVQLGLANTDHWQGERHVIRRDGTPGCRWMSVSRVRAASGEAIHYVVMMTDITALKQTQNRVAFLARRDTLTGLPNRTSLLEALDLHIQRARVSEAQVGVLSIDLDRFKIINESLGHQVGDRVLRAVVERLQACLPEGATFGRLGGDEFMVMLVGERALRDAESLARRILEALAEPVMIEHFEFVIGASIGLCAFPGHGDSVEILLKNADTAMYRAKSRGRARFAVYDETMSAEIVERMSLEAELRVAVARGQLVTYYQPQFDLISGRIVGAEALLRWRHPTMGMIPPDRFIPIAEDTGLIIEIGQWVLDAALGQLARWQAQGLSPGHIAVNVAGPQIWQSDFVERVRDALARHQVDPSCLHLELTETLIMSEATHAETLRRLDALRSLGLTLAIDDFGTGHSSLSHLKRLPVSILKIDRSFVLDIARDADDEAIVRAIIALARALKLTVIAEGIETAAQQAFLRAEGCGFGQGYLMARPVPADELGAMLRDALVVRDSALSD